VGASAPGTAYALASVPAIPEDAHFALADYATASILASVGTPGKAEWFRNRFASRIANITQTFESFLFHAVGVSVIKVLIFSGDNYRI
jgi:hypothetical protein